MNPELQNAQDMLTAILNQRNAAQNECVQLAAQILAKDRKIAELEAKVKESASKENPSDEFKPANGRDPDFEAVMQ